MDIKPIHNEDDYKVALSKASAYFNNQPEPGSVDGDRFELFNPKRTADNSSEPVLSGSRTAEIGIN